MRIVDLIEKKRDKNSLTKEDELFALSVLNKMPIHTFKENWPYGQL